MWTECGTLKGPENILKVYNSFEWWFCFWTTFHFSHLWLMPLTNTFLCCFWQRVALRTLPRLYRLDCILLPASLPACPREPQPTSARVKEMALISFPFSHIKWGTRGRSVCRTWPSWINSQATVCVCVHMYSIKACVLRSRWVHFFLSQLYITCWYYGKGKYLIIE